MKKHVHLNADLFPSVKKTFFHQLTNHLQLVFKAAQMTKATAYNLFCPRTFFRGR
jgi:hypothetical protein